MDYTETLNTLEENLKTLNKLKSDQQLIASAHHFPTEVRKHAKSAVENLTAVISSLEDLQANISWEQPARFIPQMVQSSQNNTVENKQPVKAKQNLEELSEFETLIVTSPNCDDTIILAIKNGKLIIRNFCNEDATEETINKHTEDLSCIRRDIVVNGKINILASNGLKKPLLFSIEEGENGLKITSADRVLIENQNNLIK